MTTVETMIHYKSIYIFMKLTEFEVFARTHNKNYCGTQGRIQDFKLGGGGALKKIAPSGGRCENLLGISCEKSRFYAKKIIFFPILGGAPGASPTGSAPGTFCYVNNTFIRT